jgi:hypothetical protein
VKPPNYAGHATRGAVMINRIGIASVNSLAVICATLVALTAQPTFAQSELTDDRIRQFSGAIAGNIPDAVTAQTIAIAGNAGSRYYDVGYYKIYVKRIGDNPIFESNRPCKEFVRSSTGVNPEFSFLFNTKTDLGVALKIPLTDEAGGGSSFAELPLFRFTSNEKGKCLIDQPYFALDSSTAQFVTPLMPLKLYPDGQELRLQFRPWLATSPNAGRVSALWKGIGAFAKLLGPIGDVASLLIDDKKADSYAIRSQAQASIFDFAQTRDPTTKIEIKESNGPKIERTLLVAPVLSNSEASAQTQKLTASWQFRESKSGGQTINLSYEIGVSFVASRLGGGDSSEIFKTDWKDSELERLLVRNAELPDMRGLDGVPTRWEHVTPSIINLAAQKDTVSFSAACKPALDDLRKLRLSEPDQALLIYAIARMRSKLDAAQLSQVKCFQDSRFADALSRFGVRIASNSADDVARTTGKALAAFRKPNASPSRIAPISSDNVVVTGRTALLTGNATALLPNEEKMNQAGFVARFATFGFTETSMAAPCWVADWDTGDIPFNSSGAVSTQPPVAFLGVRKIGANPEQVILIVLGLAAKDDDHPDPPIATVWVGDERDLTDPDVRSIRTKMATNGLCTAESRFASFFAAVTPP